jgi:hypothetical protein
MTSKGGEVHGVLSFAIGLISDEGRVPFNISSAQSFKLIRHSGLK